MRAVPCVSHRTVTSGSGYIPGHVNIYRHLSIHLPTNPPTDPRICPRSPILVYLHPSITCGLVMRTARDDARDGPIIRYPIIRHLSRSASPPPLLFIPTRASAYAHRYRGICKKRKMYTERRVSIERQIQRGMCLCVYIVCVYVGMYV